MKKAKSGGSHYVYTLGAARSRFRRGYKNVLIFVPNDGRLINLTKSNIKTMARLYFPKGHP